MKTRGIRGRRPAKARIQRHSRCGKALVTKNQQGDIEFVETYKHLEHSQWAQQRIETFTEQRFTSIV